MDTPEVPASVLSHQKLLDEFAVKQRSNSLTLSVPTDDNIVKKSLRYYEQPITLFGEGPYERRERLRLLVARKVVLEGETEIFFPSDASTAQTSATTATSQGGKVETQVPEKETFYTEGSITLLAHRERICLTSLEKAKKRLNELNSFQSNYTLGEYNEIVDDFHKHMKNNLNLVASQVADDRPPTQGIWGDDVYISTGWTGLVKVWDVPSCNNTRTLRGHTDRVNGLAYTNKSENINLASACSDTNICLWDINTQSSPKSILSGHENRVNQLAFHPTHNGLLASTSHDETWRLWDIDTSEELYFQEGHRSPISPIKFHPDGSLVITGDHNGRVVVWDIRIGKSVLYLHEHAKLVYTLDFDPLFPHRFISGSDDHTTKVWDLRQKKSIKTLLTHDKLVSSALFEPKYGRYILTASYDCRVRFWSPINFSVYHELALQETRITNASVSNNGKWLSVLSFDRTWKLWELSDFYDGVISV